MDQHWFDIAAMASIAVLVAGILHTMWCALLAEGQGLSDKKSSAQWGLSNDEVELLMDLRLHPDVRWCIGRVEVEEIFYIDVESDGGAA